MNRFGRCAMVIGGALLVSGIVMQAPTFAASFETMGKPTFLYMDTRNVNLNAEGERVSFILQRDGVLRMCSRDGQHDYLSFTGYYGGNDGIGYSINKIEMKNPNKTFFVINANQGAHAKNAGFWIVGKYKDQWTCFVSLDTLANAGYTVGEWHQLKVVTDTTGYGTSNAVYITSQHEYMPPGAIYGYQRKFAVDFRAALNWDDQAQWFSITRLQ